MPVEHILYFNHTVFNGPDDLLQVKLIQKPEALTTRACACAFTSYSTRTLLLINGPQPESREKRWLYFAAGRGSRDLLDQWSR